MIPFLIVVYDIHLYIYFKKYDISLTPTDYVYILSGDTKKG